MQPGTQLPRLLTGIVPGRPLSWREHLSVHGPLPVTGGRHARDVVDMLASSGLRGRGGGWFPTADKLRAVAAQRGRPVVVINALEGEPVSRKDKLLVRHTPHLLLDGAVLCAHSLGARRVIVGVSERAVVEQQALAAAMAEREACDADPGVGLELGVVPAGFVSGEETALVHFLNSGICTPTARPPLPFMRGVGGAPTLVQNAETACHIGLIGRHGAAWFRALGTVSEPGSALVTVTGAVKRPGVFELALGTPLATVISRAGGFSERPRALLLGGYFGTWVAAADAAGLALTEADLRRVGARFGAGAITVLPSSTCAVNETARVARYLASESAGQCGPCVYGLEATAATLEQIAAGRRPGNDAARALQRILGQVDGRGACRHPDGAVRFVSSALRVFADEFEQHLQHRCSLPRERVLPVSERGLQ